MAKKKDTDEVFYVRISDPSVLKKVILESVKDTIDILKAYDAIKGIRIEKVKEISQLKELIAEIDILVNKLKRVLPKSRGRQKPEPLMGKRTGARKGTERKTKHIDKLEEDLAKIEAKLGKL